jgi:DNA-binding response OmpR family regulator
MLPKLLVVEDDPALRRLLEYRLRRHFTVLTAEHGGEALEVIDEHEPVIVLSDLMMPVMDGYELLRRIRTSAKHADTPFLVVTAKVSAMHDDEGLTEADGVVVKPFDFHKLIERIKSTLEEHAARKEA